MRFDEILKTNSKKATHFEKNIPLSFVVKVHIF